MPSRHVLADGTLEITGRLTDASNLTLLATASLDGIEIDCVYKPIRGERPLWDFPDGTLADREVAARRIAEYAGVGLRSADHHAGRAVRHRNGAAMDRAAGRQP